MSRYTTELRYLSNWTDEQIGLGKYPIFDDAHRSTLNRKIREYYCDSEIGFETPAMFALKLGNKMDIIMPYYNELYKTLEYDINPFLTMDYTVDTDEHQETHEDKDTDATVNQTDTVTSKKDFDKTSDTNNTTTSQQTDDISYTDNDTGVLNKNAEPYTNTLRKEGGTDSTRTGSQTNTRTGSETDSGAKGNTYRHGLTIGSTTPEGFVTTESITNDTWASDASKFRERTEQESDDKYTKTYNSVSDKLDYNNVKDITQFLPNTVDTSIYGKRDETDTHDNTSKHLEHRDSDGETNTDATMVEQSAERINNLDVLERIDKAITDINAQLQKNSNVHYKGFSGKTMSEMLKEFRDNILNIDQMIIEDLHDLFICVLN